MPRERLSKPTTNVEQAMDQLATAVFAVRASVNGDPGLSADNAIGGVVRNFVDSRDWLRTRLDDLRALELADPAQ